MDKVFVVKNDVIGEVYFDNRKACADYIVDEFGMALMFTNDKEPMKLAEYLMSHNETPNQYPYKYYIEERSINKEYNNGEEKKYIVQSDWKHEGEHFNDVYLYDTYQEALEIFNDLVDADAKEFGSDEGVECELSEGWYERWFKTDYDSHYWLKIITLTKKNGKWESD